LLALGSWALLSGTVPDSELMKARDQQNGQALDGMIARDKAAAGPGTSAEAQYQLALAYSYAAEVAMELRDKKKAESYAVTGLEAAKKAVAGNERDAEYHRLLGALCGQVIPANPLMGALSYGSCARDEINKAIALNGNLALAYVSRGIGNFYLPAQMGGGVDLALKDVDKAIALDPTLADAYLWKGVILRKANRNAEARAAFTQALKLDPDRLWAKQQLDKTSAQ
jgi:tetratricopeptide (TPR) repeat protein